ncbi:MAG: restriction endonuclease [Acidimicrobiia bacterium]
MEVNNWRDFEILAAGVFEGLVPTAIVEHDRRIKDEHGVSHQIDVHVEIPIPGDIIRILLDTKLWKKKVGKGDIQKLAKTRDQLGYHLAGVVANRLEGFSQYAKAQAALDDIRLFDLSHWLIADHGGWQIGVTGGGPFSDEFVAATRVVSLVPLAEGPIFHHPDCEPDCSEPNFDWVTEPGATVAQTIRLWLDEGVMEVWRSEAINDAFERAGELSEGHRSRRNYEIIWDRPISIRAPKSASWDTKHGWRGYIIVTEIELLPASGKHTEWFLRRLDEGEWRFLAALGSGTLSAP